MHLGRSHARSPLFLSALALLFGLLAAALAEAQNVAPPTNLAAAPGDGKLTVTWTNPAAVTAAPSNYRTGIRWKAQNTSNWLNPAGVGDPASNGLTITQGSSSYEITGLTNGRTYVVEIGYVRLNPYALSHWASTTGRPYAPAVTLSAAPTTVTEGDSVTVTARLSGALSSTVTIPVSVARNTSESGDHGTLSSIAINAGSTAGTATIATNQDTDADDETFTVTLGSSLPSGVVAGSATSVQITIADDEGPPAVALRASPNPVGEGSSVTVTATLTKALTQPVTIPLTVTRGTAEPGDYGTDYFWKPFPITIPANMTKSMATIRTNQDSDVDDETFTVALGALPSSVRAVGASSSVEVTIVDDDMPAISLSARRTTVPEGELVLITMTFSKPVPLSCRKTVWIPVNVSAEAVGYARQLGIPVSCSTTSTSFRVSTEVDSDDIDEEFTVSLDTANLPGWARAGDSSSVVLTIDDAAEATVSLSVPRQRVREGSSVTVTARLSKALSNDLRVPVALKVGWSDTTDAAISAPHRAEDGDFHAPRNYIAIPAGSTTGTLEVQARHDADTDDERFRVSLRGSLAQVAWPPTQVGLSVDMLIIDDDEPTLIRVGGTPHFAVHEDRNDGAHFHVYLSHAVSWPVTVDYTTKNGTVSTQYKPRWLGNGRVEFIKITNSPAATAPADYTKTAGTLTFAPGETRKLVFVPIVNDTVEDSDENFRFAISNPSAGGRIAYAETSVVILNDEADLGSLSVEGAAGAGGPWSALDPGAFAAETTDYAVTVPHGTTQARLVPTAAEPGTTMKTGAGSSLESVQSGEAGPAVALGVGENTLVVAAVARSGAQKTYRVTVTRQAATRDQQTPKTEQPTQVQDLTPPEEEPEQQQQEKEAPDQETPGTAQPTGEGQQSEDEGDEDTNGEPQIQELEAPEEEEPEQQQQEKDSSLNLRGTNGPDNLDGSDAGDTLIGRQGDDVLRGLGGNDELRGGKDNDDLHGGRGADKLYGGEGDDRLYGDRGADRLFGGNGDDTYTGGPGQDRFIFLSGEMGDKIITDFEPGDLIVLRADGDPWPSVADIIAGVVAQDDRYFVYTLSNGLTVETDMALDAGDFQSGG